jgi:hypothetical protein
MWIGIEQIGINQLKGHRLQMTPAITHATQKELLCCTEIITYVRTYVHTLALRILSACSFTHKHRASIESVACTCCSCEPLPIMIEFGKNTYAHAAHLHTLIASLFPFHHPT